MVKPLDKILRPRSLRMIDLLDDTLLYIADNFDGVEFSQLLNELRKQVAEINFTPILNTVLQELIQERYIYIYEHSQTFYGEYLATESTTVTTYYCISSKGERFCKAPLLIYKRGRFIILFFRKDEYILEGHKDNCCNTCFINYYCTCIP